MRREYNRKAGLRRRAAGGANRSGARVLLMTGRANTAPGGGATGRRSGAPRVGASRKPRASRGASRVVARGHAHAHSVRRLQRGCVAYGHRRCGLRPLAGGAAAAKRRAGAARRRGAAAASNHRRAVSPRTVSRCERARPCCPFARQQVVCFDCRLRRSCARSRAVAYCEREENFSWGARQQRGARVDGASCCCCNQLAATSAQPEVDGGRRWRCARPHARLPALRRRLLGAESQYASRASSGN